MAENHQNSPPTIQRTIVTALSSDCLTTIWGWSPVDKGPSSSKDLYSLSL